MGECLTKSPIFLKLENDQCSPTVGPILRQSTSVPYAQLNSFRVESCGLCLSFDVCSGLLFVTLLDLLFASVETAIIAFS